MQVRYSHENVGAMFHYRAVLLIQVKCLGFHCCTEYYFVLTSVITVMWASNVANIRTEYPQGVDRVPGTGFAKCQSMPIHTTYYFSIANEKLLDCMFHAIPEPGMIARHGDLARYLGTFCFTVCF